MQKLTVRSVAGSSGDFSVGHRGLYFLGQLGLRRVSTVTSAPEGNQLPR